MTTYVILCWSKNRGRYECPDAILGPFTHRKANQVADKLTCRHKLWQITTEAPPWATN